MSATPQQWSDNLLEALKQANQRILIDVSGDLDWCLSIATVLTQQLNHLILSDHSNHFPNQQITPFKKTIQLLGQETNAIIYDAFSGFDADAFARAAGLIKSPGFLIMVRPKTEDWLNTPDLKNIWQNEQPGRHHFINYLSVKLTNSAQAINLQQGYSYPKIPIYKYSEKTNIDKSLALSKQQLDIWRQLNTIFNTQKKTIAILAERGRGKSTLIGRWLSQKDISDKHIILTSDSKNAVAQCTKYISDNSSIEYCAIDALLQSNKTADCVIVDEAATLPIALLNQLNDRYDRVIYSTTTDGYEGTSGGFKLKFLESNSDTIELLALTKPIRWGQNDYLEQWLNDVYLVETLENKVLLKSQDIIYKTITQKALSNDDMLLNQCFQLLRSAHYRTKPSDLKMLLDNPDLNIMIATQNKHVVGILLLSAEGCLDEALSQEIYYGRRRPQGHILAQSLTAHASCKGFAQLKGFRVQRVAVLKSLRQQGIGSKLLAQAIDYAKQHNADYLGTMFALEKKHLNFWHKNQLSVMMVSGGQGTSTGLPSMTMMLSFSPVADQYRLNCEHALKNNFSERLLTQFKAMDAQQLIALIKILPSLAKNNFEQCDPYINGYKGFDLALADLRSYVLYLLQHASQKIEMKDQILLLQAILQNQAWSKVIKTQGLSGKKELNNTLKAVLQRVEN